MKKIKELIKSIREGNKIMQKEIGLDIVPIVNAKYKIIKCIRCDRDFKVLKKEEDRRYNSIFLSKHIKGEEFLSDYNLCDKCKKNYEKKIVPKLEKEINEWIKIK